VTLLSAYSALVRDLSVFFLITLVHFFYLTLKFQLLYTDTDKEISHTPGEERVLLLASDFSLVSWGGVILSPLGTSATIWPTVPAPDDHECGAVGGMRIGRGTEVKKKGTVVPGGVDV
jgi:hypothetical protein